MYLQKHGGDINLCSRKTITLKYCLGRTWLFGSWLSYSDSIMPDPWWTFSKYLLGKYWLEVDMRKIWLFDKYEYGEILYSSCYLMLKSRAINILAYINYRIFYSDNRHLFYVMEFSYQLLASMLNRFLRIFLNSNVEIM